MQNSKNKNMKKLDLIEQEISSETQIMVPYGDRAAGRSFRAVLRYVDPKKLAVFLEKHIKTEDLIEE